MGKFVMKLEDNNYLFDRCDLNVIDENCFNLFTDVLHQVLSNSSRVIFEQLKTKSKSIKKLTFIRVSLRVFNTDELDDIFNWALEQYSTRM
jgi:hypothetical protein